VSVTREECELFRRLFDVDPARESPVGLGALSTDFTGTFDLAQWCKLLRDRGWTGHQVARALGRSEGYVNNLIRILERASLEVLARWKTEQQVGSSLTPICATDWLMRVCLLPPDQQRAELAKRDGSLGPDPTSSATASLGSASTNHE
jgi:hypothetical protein